MDLKSSLRSPRTRTRNKRSFVKPRTESSEPGPCKNANHYAVGSVHAATVHSFWLVLCHVAPPCKEFLSNMGLIELVSQPQGKLQEVSSPAFYLELTFSQVQAAPREFPAAAEVGVALICRCCELLSRTTASDAPLPPDLDSASYQQAGLARGAELARER